MATVTLVRRSLEVRRGWRALLAFVPAAIGAAIIARGVMSAIAGAVLLAVSLATLALPLFSPERVRRRLLAAARELIPDSDGWVTLIGVADEASELLTAPYSKRRCIAYWARAVAVDTDDESCDAGVDSEQRSAVCDFSLDVGGVRVLVTARDARLAYDRSRGEVVSFAGAALQTEPVTAEHRGRHREEEILLRPGECVVVRGLLVHGPSEAPHRAAARLVPARTRPIAVALGGADR